MRVLDGWGQFMRCYPECCGHVCVANACIHTQGHAGVHECVRIYIYRYIYVRKSRIKARVNCRSESQPTTTTIYGNYALLGFVLLLGEK